MTFNYVISSTISQSKKTFFHCHIWCICRCLIASRLHDDIAQKKSRVIHRASRSIIDGVLINYCLLTSKSTMTDFQVLLSLVLCLFTSDTVCHWACLLVFRRLKLKQTWDDPSMFFPWDKVYRLNVQCKWNFYFRYCKKQGEREKIRDWRCRAKWPTSTLTETVIALPHQTSLPSECYIQQLIIIRAWTNIILNLLVFHPFHMLKVSVHCSPFTCRTSHVVSFSLVCLLFATDDAYEGISSLL